MEQENDKKKFLGAWIPADVLSMDNISMTDKVLLGQALTMKTLFASNAHLAKKVGMSEDSVSRSINKLIKLGYLEKTGFNGRFRKITVSDEFIKMRDLGLSEIKRHEEEEETRLKHAQTLRKNAILSRENDTLPTQIHDSPTAKSRPSHRKIATINKREKKSVNKKLNKSIEISNIGNDIFPEQFSTSSNEVSLESKDSVNVDLKNENLDFNNSPNNEPLEGPTITNQPVEPKTTKPSTISELVEYYNIPTEEYGRKLSRRELQMRIDEFEVAERLAAHKQKMELKKQLEEENTIKFSQNEPELIQIQNTQPQPIEKCSISSFKGSLTASNNENTQSTIIEPKSSQIANKQAKPYANTSKAYYDTLKELKTPIRNHNNLRGYIKRLEDELGEKIAVKYLDFLKNVYPTLNDDGFKPTISESIDIYAKRESISNWVKKQSNKKPNLI